MQRTIAVSLNHTLQVLHMNKVFQSHFKSSQVDFLFLFYDELSVVMFYREFRNIAPFAFKITPLHGFHGKHRLPLLWMHVYSCVAWKQTSYISVHLLGVDSIESTVSLLLLPLFVFTELLPGNALIKSVTIYLRFDYTTFHPKTV
jgi:hypothetical protein